MGATMPERRQRRARRRSTSCPTPLPIDTTGFVVACNEDARRLFGCDPTGDAIAGLLNQTELHAARRAGAPARAGSPRRPRPVHRRLEG